MLNRRSLRIKVMQYLYALERQKEAFAQISKTAAGSYFDPNLNQDELPDLESLRAKKNEAHNLFDKKLDRTSTEEGDLDEEVVAAVEGGLTKFQSLVEESKKLGLDQLIKESKELEKSYYKLLSIPVAWKELIMAEWNRLLSDEKLPPKGFRNLIDNPLVIAIEENQAIHKFNSKNNIGWDSNTLSEWYRKVLKKDERYLSYSGKANPTQTDHQEFLSYLYKKVIFKHEVISDYMEERDIGWSENRAILKSMIVKTLKTFDSSTKSIELINLSPNWKEDEEFYKKLYSETLSNESEFEEIISSKSKNWDSERIAAVDKIIMKMALTEFTRFPSIPVKVTINEYIEICKLYSTPKSKQYVNGILDVLSNEMIKDGRIKKSGRGLLDNK